MLCLKWQEVNILKFLFSREKSLASMASIHSIEGLPSPAKSRMSRFDQIKKWSNNNKRKSSGKFKPKSSKTFIISFLPYLLNWTVLIWLQMWLGAVLSHFNAPIAYMATQRFSVLSIGNEIKKTLTDHFFCRVTENLESCNGCYVPPPPGGGFPFGSRF